MSTARTNIISTNTRAGAVIANAPRGRRMSWFQVKGLHTTGKQEKTI